MRDHSYFANLIWQIADLLRGPYRPPQYERVMLPMTVLRRFDCVLAPTKAKVLAEHKRRKGGKLKGDALEKMLNRAAGQRFHNRSHLDFEKLQGDPDNIAQHLTSYIQGFSAEVRRIFVEHFEFGTEIEKMREANILYLVVSQFRNVDLHPDRVPNEQMGLIFENLIRRFNELANETAGDHFTPREVIRLMVSLLFIHDDELLAKPGVVRTLLDPACGTGGMLAEAQNYLRGHHRQARLYVYGQDYNKRAYAIAASDMLMKQVDHNGGGDNVHLGDSLTEDHFAGQTFDYFLTNPPFGVDWKQQASEVKREHQKRGYAGRFGARLPRVNDGSLLFLQHMIHKFEPVRPDEHKHGARLAIVFSGSPLFTGGAGSGESNIRRWIIENDWLEAIIALPEQMFYNTGIGTYIWMVTNNKERRRKGKIQLLDARDLWTPGGSADSKRSLGDKRRHLSGKQIEQIVRLYGRFRNGDRSKIFKNEQFGYTRVTVERPLRLRYQMSIDGKSRFLNACPWLLDDVQAIDKTLGREPMQDWNEVRKQIEELLQEQGSRWKKKEWEIFRYVFAEKDQEAAAVAKGAADQDHEPDSDLRDHERVPLTEEVDAYFEREVRPHVPDAWMDRSKDRVGYEINFNRHFYKYTPPRPLEEIDADLKKAGEEIVRLLGELTEDFGVSWVGEVPKHCRKTRLKYIAKLNYGDALSEEATKGDSFVAFGSNGPYAESAGANTESPAIIVGRKGSYGKVSWSSEKCFASDTTFFIDSRTCNHDLRWLYWVLQTLQLDEGTEEAAVPGLNREAALNRRLAVPSFATQLSIANHVDREVARLEILMEKVQETEELLRKRRAALISAVTGQIAIGDGTEG